MQFGHLIRNFQLFSINHAHILLSFYTFHLYIYSISNIFYFKSAVKHRQLGYGYPRGQTVHLAEATGDCPQFRRFSIPKVLNSEGSQVRRFSSPKINTLIICVFFYHVSILCDTGPSRICVYV